MLQLLLFRFEDEFILFFLVSIILSLIGVWLLITSVPKDSVFYQRVTPVVYIGVLSVIGGGITVFYLAILYDPTSVNASAIIVYSSLLCF